MVPGVVVSVTVRVVLVRRMLAELPAFGVEPPGLRRFRSFRIPPLPFPGPTRGLGHVRRWLEHVRATEEPPWPSRHDQYLLRQLRLGTGILARPGASVAIESAFSSEEPGIGVH